jgi:hypothetical protein
LIIRCAKVRDLAGNYQSFKGFCALKGEIDIWIVASTETAFWTPGQILKGSPKIKFEEKTLPKLVALTVH